MNFEEILKKITPKIKQLAVRYNGWNTFANEDDFFGEMVLHLREKWLSGDLKDKTESYVIQSCYFHLRNYLRVTQEKRDVVSIYDTITGDDDMTLEEIIPDNRKEVPEEKMFMDRVRNNGLTKLEKEIFEFLYEGYTAREIGEKLHISHTMVLRHKKDIAVKVSKEYNFLLV